VVVVGGVKRWSWVVVCGGGDPHRWLLVADVGGRNDGGGWETKVLFVDVFVSAVSSKHCLCGSV